MGSFDLGWQSGQNQFAEHRARKEQLADEERRGKAEPLFQARQSLLAKMPNLTGKDLEDAHGQLAALTNSWNELYHPTKAPGALERDSHWLLGKIKNAFSPKDTTPAAITSQTPAVVLDMATPAPITTPELPGYEQKTPQLPSKGGPVATQVPGVASQTVPGMSAPAAPQAPPLLVTQSFADKDVPGLVSKGNIDLTKRPNIDNGDGTHSSTFSMSFGTDDGEVLVPGVGDGKTYPERQLRVLYTLPDGTQKWAVPGNQPHNWIAPERPTPQNNEALAQYQKTGKHFGIFKDDKAADAYGKTLHEDQEKHGFNGVTAHPVSGAGNIVPAGSQTTVTKAPPVPWGQAQLLKKKAEAMQKAQREAEMLAAGVGLSPEQQAGVESSTQLAKIQGAIKNFKTINPSATDDEVAAYANSLLPGYATAGNWKRIDGTIDGKPTSISYDGKSGRYRLEDGSMSLTPPEGFVSTEKSNGARPVPYYNGAVNLETARQMQNQGTVYNGENGNPIDLNALPVGSVLLPVYLGGGKNYWSVATDRGRYETGDNLRKFEPAVGPPSDNPPTVGQARVPTSRSSVTPGPNGPVVTTSVTSPITGGTRGGVPQSSVPAGKGIHGSSISSGSPQGSSSSAKSSSSEIPPIRDPKLPALKGADERAIASIASPIATVEQQVVGRGAKPLWEYSSVLNNPDLLKSVNLAMAASMLQTPEGSKNPGFWETVTKSLGLATVGQQVTTAQIVAARNKVQQEGGPQAVEFLDRLSELKGTIPNLRKIQGGSSAMGAMQPLYQESPIMNISTPEDFRNRTANMLRTMAVALEQTPGINKQHVNWLYGQADKAQTKTPSALKQKAQAMNAPYIPETKTPSSQFKVNDQVMLNGNKVTITRINPDGTFEYK